MDGVELDIVVFDDNQQKTKEIKGYRAKTRIDVSKWNRGNYFVHIFQDGRLVKKLRLKIEN